MLYFFFTDLLSMYNTIDTIPNTILLLFYFHNNPTAGFDLIKIFLYRTVSLGKSKQNNVIAQEYGNEQWK